MAQPVFTSTLEAPDLLVIEAHGAIDAVTMEVALDMLAKDMEGMAHGNLLMRAGGVEWPTLGAIGVELRHFGQMMGLLRKIDKVALLSDWPFYKFMAQLESALIPNLVIKGFNPDEEAQARAWLAEPSRVDATA